jgi:hypothetical protein
MKRLFIGLPPIECSSIDCLKNRQLAIANRQYLGGGEGSRTPDPMVANHVLCQLSYTPDKNFGFRIWDFELQIRNPKFRKVVAGAGFEPATFGL